MKEAFVNRTGSHGGAHYFKRERVVPSRCEPKTEGKNIEMGVGHGEGDQKKKSYGLQGWQR